MTLSQEITVYTDGACDGNPGPGGWAAIIIEDGERRELSGGYAHTTNNRMELRAAIEALSSLAGRDKRIKLHTDSEYLRRGITEWMPSWKMKAWRKARGGAVLNADLWQRLDTLAQALDVDWHWVRGHAGNVNNERCDRLANQEVRRILRGEVNGKLDGKGASPPAAQVQGSLFNI